MKIILTNGLSGLNTSKDIYILTDNSSANGMWLAAPHPYGSYLYGLTNSGSLLLAQKEDMGNDYLSWNSGTRPIVCLNSSVTVEKQADGTYILK